MPDQLMNRGQSDVDDKYVVFKKMQRESFSLISSTHSHIILWKVFSSYMPTQMEILPGSSLLKTIYIFSQDERKLLVSTVVKRKSSVYKNFQLDCVKNTEIYLKHK